MECRLRNWARCILLCLAALFAACALDCTLDLGVIPCIVLACAIANALRFGRP